jgi:lipoate-protein ligase A
LTWRILDTGLADPYYVTAIDEALAISIGEHGGIETLHFYGRDPPAVSVGYFRKVDDDVNLEYCKNNDIKIVRRTSAGGTIYTDRDQLIFSLISRKPLGKNIEETFKNVCNGVIAALKGVGIDAEFKTPNDIIINGKKVSGSAQVKKKNTYLIHGTLILALDKGILRSVLKNSTAEYISSIETECGFQPELKALKTEISKAFQIIFGLDFHHGILTNQENEIIQELLKNKYSNPDWNFKR